MRIAVVDYGAGNLASVLKGLRAAGAQPSLARVPRDLDDAGGVVVPGVGHFSATGALDASWRDALRASVGGSAGTPAVPLLGICLGMQWLFDGSDEAPDVPGLGLVRGRARRMVSVPAVSGAAVKVPHVGWNALEIVTPTAASAGIESGAAMYFTHSYAVDASPDACAMTTHGRGFVSVVTRGRVWGAQFHPEKSGSAGLAFLRNWIGQCSANV